MAGAPLGGKGEHGHPGVHVQERLAVAGGSNGNLGQGLGIRIGIDGAVGEQDDAVLPEAAVLVTIRKKEETVLIPLAGPTVWKAALSTLPVVPVAPATSPPASPQR